MKVVCEAHFLELTPHEGETALKKSQGSSVPKAYSTQQSCTKELTYNLSRGYAKAGRVIKGYIVLEDVAVAVPKVTPRSGIMRTTASKSKTTTVEDLLKELGFEDTGELPF